MAHRHVIATLALTVVSASLASAPQAARAEPISGSEAPYTAISIRSATGSGATALHAGIADVRVDPWTDGFQMSLSQGVDEVGGVILQGPEGVGLAEGTYTVVPFGRIPGPGEVSARLTEDHSTCDLGSGQVTVTELTRAVDSSITSLAADLNGACAFDDTVAQIRYQAQPVWSGLHVPGFVSFPDTKIAHPSETHEVAVAVRGTEPVTLGAATLEPTKDRADGTEDFAIVSDGCSGTTVQPGGTCAVAVRGIPTGAGTTWATLEVPDDSAVGNTEVDLAVRGVEDATGTYYSVGQSRLLDTRHGIGAPKAPVGPGREISLLVAGRGNVPTQGVSAVVMNLTAVAPTKNTYLTAYPSGTTRPTTSSLNLSARAVRANLVTLPVGADGRVRIFNAAGDTNVLADVLGFYAKDSSLLADRGMGRQYQVFSPTRLFDSRVDGGALESGERVTISADFGAEANENVRALALNITVLGATASGYVRVYAATTPNASTVNFAAGQTVPNMTVADTLFDDGVPQFTVRNDSAGRTHVLVDAVGVFTAGEPSGLRFRPLAPQRILDTRFGLGTAKAPLGAKESRLFTAPTGVAGDDTWALVANTTAVKPTASTYLTIWGEDIGAKRPNASNVNAAAGEVAANATLTPMGPGNRFRIFNAAGVTNTVMDVTGSFEIYPSYSVWDVEGGPSASMAQARSGTGALVPRGGETAAPPRGFVTAR